MAKAHDNSFKRHRASAEEQGIGKIITGDQYRDAVHVAIVPVMAGEDLNPGQHIAVEEGQIAWAKNMTQTVGIVDPFLMAPVKRKEKFWAFLYPGTITSLRHAWTHPQFGQEDGQPMIPSEKWIRDFAERVGLGYRDLMDGAKEYAETGDYMVRGGLLEGEYVPPEFWFHYEAVTGQRVEAKDRGNFFSCSC